MAASLQFKLPTEPSPMPTMGSDDEESFVVLGKSLIPDVDLSFTNLTIEPLQSGPIEEGKRLINMELSQLEASNFPQMSYMAPHVPTNEESKLSSMNIISSELSPDEVQQKVDSLIAENVKLRETIIRHNTVMESQHERIVAWKEEVQKTHQAHKLKFAEAKDFISKLKNDNELLSASLEKANEIREMQQAELFKLKHELKQKDIAVKGTETTPSLILANSHQNEELEQQKLRITELEKLLQITHLAKDRIAKENDDMKLSSSNSEKLVQQLTNDIQEKDKVIEQLNKKFKDLEESSTRTIKTLNTDILNLRSQLCLSVNVQEDLDNARKQLMASQASIIGLQQANSVLSAQLSVEQEKLKELEKWESLKDDYLALEQQVNVYKADYEVERQAKLLQKNEKEQVIKEFLQIQKRNNELNEEIELIRERGFEVIQRNREASHSENSGNSSAIAPGETRYTCPICNFGFTELQTLENHVERCLDISAALP